MKGGDSGEEDNIREASKVFLAVLEEGMEECLIGPNALRWVLPDEFINKIPGSLGHGFWEE